MSHDASQQAFAAAAAEFDTLARRFWGAWSEALQPATGQGGHGFGQSGFGPGAAGMPGFGAGAGVPGFAVAGADPTSWWANLAQASAAQHAASRFDGLARQWFAQMQQLAAQFAGRDSSAGEVVDAWRKMLANSGGNPFAQMLASAQQRAGSLGPQAWLAQAAPWLQRMQGGAGDWLQTPTFGFAREHQERWQALAQAQIELQQKMEAYNALMARVTQDGLAIFERKLADREAPGLQIDSPRALFDLWIDAAEEAYAPVALGEEFRHVYAALVDAQMRVRQGVQREVEQVCALFDMPTRTELDGAHRKVVELERQVRRLRDAVAALAGGHGGQPGASTPGKAGNAVARNPSRGRSGEPAPASRRPGRKQVGETSRAATPVPTRGEAQAAAGPAAGGGVPRGSKVAAGGAGAKGNRPAGTRVTRTTGARSKPAARKAAATRRPKREVAVATAREGQRTLFSATHAMPAAPKPLKKGKR